MTKFRHKWHPIIKWLIDESTTSEMQGFKMIYSSASLVMKLNYYLGGGTGSIVVLAR